MAIDKVIDSAKLNGALKATADKIREKTGSTEEIQFDMDTGFVNAIGAIGDIELLEELLDKTITSYSNHERTSVPDYTFRQCAALTSVDMPNLTTVGKEAFYNCTSLSEIDLSKVTTIDNLAFYRNSLREVDLSNVVTIGNEAFRGAESLTLIGDTSKIKTLGSMAFDNCHSIEGEVYFPSLTSFGTFCFRGCKFTKFSAPILTSTSNSAFTNCSNLEHIDLPMCTSLASYLFANNGGPNDVMKKIILPSCTNISNYAFSLFRKLEILVLPVNQVCSLGGADVFVKECPICTGTGHVYVPTALIESYKTATNWSSLYAANPDIFVAIEGSEYE